MALEIYAKVEVCETFIIPDRLDKKFLEFRKSKQGVIGRDDVWDFLNEHKAQEEIDPEFELDSVTDCMSVQVYDEGKLI